MESVGHARSGLQDCRRGGRGGTGILTYIHALIPRNMRYTPYIHTIQHNTHTRFRPDLVILAAGGVVMTVCTLGSPSCRRPVPVDSRDGRWVVDAQKADCQTSGVCLYVFTASADPHPKPRGFAATGRRDLLSKHISSLRRASARRLFAAGLPPPSKTTPVFDLPRPRFRSHAWSALQRRQSLRDGPIVQSIRDPPSASLVQKSHGE